MDSIAMRTILKMMTIPLVMNKVVCAYILGADHLIKKNKAAFREQLREYRCSLVKSIFLFLQVTQAVYTFATKVRIPRNRSSIVIHHYPDWSYCPCHPGCAAGPTRP